MTRSANPSERPIRIGCVSFLNAKPLIDGIADDPSIRPGPPPEVRYDVPSRLLADLEAGRVDIALCPVIDYQRSRSPLWIVPVGGIGCEGTTLTVRLYSAVPIERTVRVHADTDSHTSVALLRVVLRRRLGREVEVIDLDARGRTGPAAVASRDPEQAAVEWPQTMLLIGDKVVTDSPPAVRYPYQLDLGEAWREMTGLPFVFAAWMCREGTDLGGVPEMLDALRRRNACRIEGIVDRHAPGLGWPRDLALEYLGRWLRYDIGPRQLEAINRFWDWCAGSGVIGERRAMRCYGRDSGCLG